MKKKLFLLGASFALLTACSSSKSLQNQVIDLDAVKNETIINLKVGEKVVVKAQTNPSTGYSWNKTVDDDCSVSIEKEEKEDIYTDGRIGAPVMEKTTIVGDRIGSCTIAFDYSRSWESERSIPKKIIFNVK